MTHYALEHIVRQSIAERHQAADRHRLVGPRRGRPLAAARKSGRATRAAARALSALGA